MYLAGLFKTFVVLSLTQQAWTEKLPVPVALYPLNGRHGTKDESPNKNPPGIPSHVQLAPGPHGHPQGSYQFSGTFNSYIEIPNHGGLDTSYSITFLAWVSRENEEGPIFSYGRATSGFDVWIVTEGYFFARSRSWPQGFRASPKLSKSWHYVGVTYDFSSGVMRLWVNGEIRREENVGSVESDTHYEVRLGAKDDANDQRYFKGCICCIQVYSTALSRQEIIAVQNRTVWQTQDSLPGPVALYPLNGRHGTKDISRNENPQGIPSNTALAPGPNGHPYGSFQFSGTPTSYIHIPNNGGLDIKNSITILAWVNRESNQGPIFEYSCETCFRLWFVDDGRLYCNAKWAGHKSSPIPSKSWYHVGATYDSSSDKAEVWLNGRAILEINDNNGYLGTHYDLRIAARPKDSRPFKGRICCIQVYDKALNQQEIIAVQNRTLLENIDDQFYPVSQTHQPQQSDFLTKITSSTVMECLTRCSRLHECNSVVFDGISTGQSMKGFCQLYKAQFEESLGHDIHQENMHKRHFNKRKRQI